MRKYCFDCDGKILKGDAQNVSAVMHQVGAVEMQTGSMRTYQLSSTPGNTIKSHKMYRALRISMWHTQSLLQVRSKGTESSPEQAQFHEDAA